MENINIASFSEANTATVKGIWQYDFGQILRIEGLGLPDAVEVHFSLQKTGGEAKRRIGVTKDGVTDVRIPDFILEEESSVKYEAYAFIYESDRIHGNTTKKIVMEIEARPKPEAFNKPCEAEIFQDTIEAVRESMAGAEASAELAEAWAHGHENHPENAEDNAKYYSGLADTSRLAAEELKNQVEQMKTSVDESKTSVEENLKASESAKELAHASAEKAKESENNAKASEAAALESAQNASASESNAKKSAESVAAQKAAVDQTVEAFNQVSTKALSDINAAGKIQQAAIEKATQNAKNQQIATEEAASKANEAASSASSATNLANTAANNANSAANSANTATQNAKDQQTAVERATKTAGSQQTSLQKVVDSAKQVDSDIQTSVKAANTAANNATEATSLANQSAEAAKTATTNANDATEKTNAAVKNASDATEQAAQATSAANAATENANQATVDAKAATQEALTQAEEAKQAAASVRDDCYPMMFRNYDGRTYSVFFEDADETMVCTGTKEDDNADVATPVPSTNAVRNENPYDEIPLFKPVECNGYADEGGELHITAVKGEPEFRTDGTKGDVCIALKTGYIRTIIDTVGIMGPLGKKGTKISVTDSWRESEYPGFPFIPYTAAIRPDGSVRPYVLIPKYQAVNFNSSYYSLPGFAPAYNVSHNGQITTFRKRGDQYCGETCSDAEIWETLFMIVFANMNSQAVMVGCTGFADQYMAAVAEENVERIILTKKQAEYFPIGCCVSIGEMGSSTNKDRGQSYMHNLANRVKVTKIEALDDDSGNYALYVDNGGVTFNTSTTTCISTMPWHTGSTDKVKGTCGSPYSNTNGKEPFKFLGIEFALGQYVVRSDVILNGVYDAEADTYQQEIYTCYDCKYFATAINEHYKKLGYVIPDSGNAWKYIKNLGFDVNFPHIRMASEYGGDSNKRFGDAVHTGTRANGTREFLSLGNLGLWSVAGLRFAGLYNWLGNGAWDFSARPSLTGRRGSVVDWASSMGVNLAA